jgi:hypothetical protein
MSLGKSILLRWTFNAPNSSLLPSLERNHRGEIWELFDGKEMIHIHFDTLGIKESPAVDAFLYIMTFEGIREPREPAVRLTGVLLRKSEVGLGSYERIGKFWIYAYPNPHFSRVEDPKDKSRGAMDNNEEGNDDTEDIEAVERMDNMDKYGKGEEDSSNQSKDSAERQEEGKGNSEDKSHQFYRS